MQSLRCLVDPPVDNRHSHLSGRQRYGPSVASDGGDSPRSEVKRAANLALKEAEFRDVDWPPSCKLLGAIERNRVDKSRPVWSVAASELHKTEGSELLIGPVLAKVSERIDEYGDRSSARFRSQKCDDALDLVDLAAVPAEARPVNVGYTVFELRSIELPPGHQ